jgi:hypothetical protein
MIDDSDCGEIGGMKTGRGQILVIRSKNVIIRLKNAIESST